MGAAWPMGWVLASSTWGFCPPHAAAIERESSATTLVPTLSMLHARRGRRRAAVFGKQDLQLRAHLEEICMQDGVHRLQPEDMTPGP